ncbi:MAG: nucleotidyltransferase domain-containing protein [Thermodesulfobacteriota bacterium]
MDVESMKSYFTNRDDVAFAFLYGSQAKGNATQLSDVDIAVYFYPKMRYPVEFEEEVFYKGEEEIWLDMEKATKKEVELLVLNRVPSTVAASVIRGIPLAINDWGLYLDFMDVLTEDAEDFMNFVINDYTERKNFEKRRLGFA